MLVFALSLFFCVPLFASWLSNFHFHFHFTFIVISSAPLLRGVCVCVFVCVCTICIDVKLHFTAGSHRGPRGSVASEDTPWVPVKTYLLYNIYI